MKGDRVTAAVTAVFLPAEVLIYAAFLLLERWEQPLAALWLKDISVILCLGYVLFLSFRGGDRLITLAVGLAVAADALLLVAGRHWFWGILLFLCVQSVCAVRLRLWGAPGAWQLRAGVALLLGLVLQVLELATPLNLLAALYFAQLVTNTLLAWHIRRRPFAAALTLFICCDVCIGLYHIVPLPPVLSGMIASGMWLFYLPAQILFVLSAKEVHHEKK